MFLLIGIEEPVYAATAVPDASTIPGIAAPRSLEDRKPIVSDPDSLVVPPVVDRPLGVDEGERVKVREFVLKGVRDIKQFGIRKEDVAFIAEANRVKRQRLDEADMEGFTSEEVDDIAEFIRRLVEEPNQRPTSAELWKLVFKLRKSEWSRGLTIGQMQEVADEITRYYRQQGLILATAFIPAQDIVDGKVTIEVLEGILGKVLPEDNHMYSTEMIAKPFKNLVGQAIQKNNIETGLLYLSDYPGMSATGVFRPGENHGESDLLLKVLDEKRFTGSVVADNNGSEFTGKYRARIDLSVNNPTGGADQLKLMALQTFSPTNGTYGNIDYHRPFFHYSTSAGINLSRNQFSVKQDLLVAREITGDSTVGSLYLKKKFHRSRGLNTYALVDFSRKQTTVNLTSANIQKDEFDVGRLELGFDHIDTRFAGINVGNLQIHQGLGTKLGASGFNNTNLKGGFNKINLNYSRLQTLYRNVSLLLNSQFQYSQQRLHSLEQMSLGGVDSVRAYLVSEYLRDVGYNVNLELLLNAPGFANKAAFKGRRWGELLTFSLFVDAGGGWLRDASPSEVKEVHLQGAGAGVKFKIPGQFKVGLQAAKVIGNQQPLNNEADYQVYFDLAYYF